MLRSLPEESLNRRTASGSKSRSIRVLRVDTVRASGVNELLGRLPVLSEVAHGLEASGEVASVSQPPIVSYIR
jgi:hypothetical protein